MSFKLVPHCTGTRRRSHCHQKGTQARFSTAEAAKGYPMVHNENGKGGPWNTYSSGGNPFTETVHEEPATSRTHVSTVGLAYTSALPTKTPWWFLRDLNPWLYEPAPASRPRGGGISTKPPVPAKQSSELPYEQPRRSKCCSRKSCGLPRGDVHTKR